MRSLIIALAILASSVSARSETMWSEKVAGWHTGAYTRNGDFSHCAAMVPYKSGIFLLFSVNKRLAWSMGLINPAWKLPAGGSYDIAFKVDDGEAKLAKAIAVSGSFVEVELAGSMELFNTFRSGQRLVVGTAGGKFQFNLTGTSRILSVLLDCAKDSGKKPVVANSNPFKEPAPAQPKPTTQNQDRADFRSEAMVVAANLVSALGISGFTFLKPSEIPTVLAVDAAWKMQGGIGGVAVLPRGSDPSSISSALIGHDAKNCKETFASGSIPSEGKGSYPIVFTKCGTGKSSVTAQYIIAPRGAGGSYIVSTYVLDEANISKERETDFRSAVFKAIQR